MARLYCQQEKDGTFFEEEATITPLRDDKGQITEYRVKRDVTHVVTLDAAVAAGAETRSDWNARGRHRPRFQQYLSAVLGYAELGRLQVEDGSPVARYFDEVIRAGERAAELVRQILTFSSTSANRNVSRFV